MNSVYRPILVTFGNLQQHAQYTYAVSLFSFAQNASVEIYRGRCFTDGEGSVAVRIDGVCRDYMYSHPRVWSQDRQDYIPAALADFDTARTPDDYILTSAEVVVYDGDGVQVANQTGVLMWYGWLPEWQHGSLVYYSGQVANLALLGNEVVPHLPPVATAQMWLEVVLQWFDATQPEFGTEGVRIPLLTDGAGCYALAYTLSALFDRLSNGEIDGGDSDSIPDEEIDGGDSDDVPSDEIDGGDSTDEYTVTAGVDLNIYHNGDVIPIAHVDACASPYYVAWILPGGGWMCFGFDGNATVSGTSTPTTIRDTMDADRIVKNDMQAVFELYSGLVTRDEYNILTTLAYVREVYLYDAVRDHGTWCTMESRSLPTAGNVRWRNEPIHITLKEKLHLEL